MKVSNQKKRDIWEKMRKNDCRDSFKADAKSYLIYSLECVAVSMKSIISGSRDFQGLFTEMLYLCSKTYSCYDNKSHKFKFSSKGLNKRVLEDSGDEPMAKYRRVLDEAVNLTLIEDSEL